MSHRWPEPSLDDKSTFRPERPRSGDTLPRVVPRWSVPLVPSLPGPPKSDSPQNPPPPPRSSNIPLYLAGVGALAAGAAYLFYGTEGSPNDTAKELGSKARGLAAAAEGKAGLRHSQADYQKVYDRIAEVMEKEDYDGGLSMVERWRMPAGQRGKER